MNKNFDVTFYQIQSRKFIIKAEYDKAVVIYKRLIRINPESFEYHSSWSQIQISQENYRNAELKCREVLILNPQHHDALKTMGVSLLKQGKYDKAVSFFEKGLKISPDNHDLTYNLAVAVTKQGYYEEAMRLCERGLIVHPHNGFLSNWTGYLYSLQGHYKEAIIEFDDALKHYPGYEMLYFNKTLALFCQNGMEEEQEKAKKVFELGVQNIKERLRTKYFLKTSVDHYNDEINRIGKELESPNLRSGTRVNLEKVKKGFEYILSWLRIEIEKPLLESNRDRRR